MPNTQFGVDRWPGNWESLQDVGACLRACEWNGEGDREEGWVKLYAMRSQADPDLTRDLLVWDRTVADRLMSGGVSAAALLAAIEANTSLLPASGTSLVQLLDETLTLNAGVTTYATPVDLTMYAWFAVFVHNTGGVNPTDISAWTFSSATAGGIASPVGSAAMALAAGATNVFDRFLLPNTMSPMDSYSMNPACSRIFRFGARSPLGTTLRVVILGRKPWARD